MIRTLAAAVGAASGWQALAWAAEEAEMERARLAIVHVCPPDSALRRLSGEPTAALVELSDPAMARAVGAIRARLGGHRVALNIRTGDPATALIDASTAVDLLAVGWGTSGRTTRRVLRRAYCPVVVVRPVSAHGDDDYFFDDTTLSTHFAVEPTALDLLCAEVEPWSRKYPHVNIRRAVLCGTVVAGLVRAAAGARLLVVGDKRRGVVSRARTGDVPLSVARLAGCPTAVVPLDRREGEPL